MFFPTPDDKESESATSSCRDFGLDDFLSARGSFDESLVIGNGGDDKQSEPVTSSCRHFEFHDILSATDNFDESLVIGRGGFGKVYKGNIIMDRSTSVVAAIKRLDTISSQGAAEFWAEVKILSKLRHCNLVSLIGYCNHGKEKILVYEYMSNGTLEDHLHKLRTPLSWLQRLKICIGAGRGLHYLHTGTGIESGVIHRDVKSSNILLHESWAAKISDFGLSKIGPTNQPKTYVKTLVKGTFGYLDPDYYATGKLTRKSDVYAFGVVMSELLCRKRAVDRSLDEEQWNLARWVQESIKEGNIKNIIDSDIRGEIAPKCLKEFVGIAERCLYTDTKQRLTMAEVLVSLEKVLIFQEKYNDSLQHAGRTLIGRMINMLPFFSNGENSAHGYSISTPRSEGDILSCSNLKSFTFLGLKSATRNFRPDGVLGEGGFGYVFKGWINESTLLPSKPGSGIVVAVKKLKPEGFQGHMEWLTEITYLGQLHHPNLVKLIGYCMEGDNRLLVYEFMPKGSLENHLFRWGTQALSWATRLKVAIGAARGLTFLHDSKDQVIYRDFKASNILLDSNFNAKLGDFGLAKAGPTGDRTHVSTQVIGTHGYAAPEYIATGRLTAKNDVYGFGVVLLELLSGRRAIDKDKVGMEQYLVEWTKPYLENKQRLFRIMDIKLEGEYPKKAAYTAATLASQCLSIEPKTRPRMSEVLATLEDLQAAKNASKVHRMVSSLSSN